LLNYDDWRVAGRPQSTQFLDYQVVNSDIEAERDHLRVGDHIVRVLTMKEAITETRPLVLDALLKIPANFYVVTEWTPLATDKARKEVNKRRRHFNMSKTGFVSQMGNDATKANPRDVLVDESKQADIENLGDCLRALGEGQSLGDFSLTIVLYGRSRTELDQLGAQFTGVFTNADGNLFAETYNQLNAYFATVPGNYALNLRQLYLLNTNYADLSFLFTILPGEKTNAHLGTECLAVVETDNSTPYFLNLHTRDVAHTLILGMTGSGKTYLRHFELVTGGGDVPEAFRVLERVRGRTLAWALEDRKGFPTSESEQTASLEADVAALQTRLMQSGSATEREQLLDKLVEYERRLGLAWTKGDEANARLPTQPVPLKIVQDDLKQDEVLLEYVLDDPNSYCVSISRQGAFVRLLPTGRKEIEKLAQQYIDQVRGKASGAEASKQLYERLLKPIPEIPNAERILVAPDGILHLLPFEALQDSRGQYLLKSHIISYVPSGTILDTLRRGRRQEAAKPLLAVGDVAYENQGGAGKRLPTPTSVRGRIERGIADLSGIALSDLPQTREEVEQIGKIVGPNAVILLGKDATETAFKEEPLDQFRVLHLAVHGFADTQYPERSALVLGTDPKSGDDGLLQVREIIRLRLNAELTTLSACDTGVGKLQGQEGISNLVEAFLVAGSKSVVASLWSADDTSASALMERFYQRLAQGENTSSALRNAKLDLLAKYGDQLSPFYWAAFITVGETSTPIGIKQQ
jgi:CHAT domain-containing protein